VKITDMKTYVVANKPGQGGGPNFVFLKLMTDEGIVGWGEPSFMKLKERSTVALINEMFELTVKGADPFNVERL
jgi:galactonate dehydratase